MRRRARAFTLIELLVVLVLLGILVGLAVLASGSSSSSRELRDEARRLAALIGVLSDEAVLDSREYGLLVSDAGYRVLRLDEATGRWDEPDRSRGRSCPSGCACSLSSTARRCACSTRQGAKATAPGCRAKTKRRSAPSGVRGWSRNC